MFADLLPWYDRAARDLPWRGAHVTPWAVLVSEIMLQQTPVARVRPAYDAWLKRWPTPAALAADSTGEAVRMWGKLGYPRRALRLHECAGELVNRFGGAVPSDVDALLSLPGVGAYTARAVAAFAAGWWRARCAGRVRPGRRRRCATWRRSRRYCPTTRRRRRGSASR
jgi:A/G-specific adenine glycosylase